MPEIEITFFIPGDFKNSRLPRPNALVTECQMRRKIEEYLNLNGNSQGLPKTQAINVRGEMRYWIDSAKITKNHVGRAKYSWKDAPGEKIEVTYEAYEGIGATSAQSSAASTQVEISSDCSMTYSGGTGTA
jgi:hypothetical protein